MSPSKESAIKAYWTAVLRLFTGNIASAGIGVVLFPLLTYLFQPGVFGQYSMILATASIFIGFSTLRLEVFALSEVDSNRRTVLLSAAWWSAIVFSSAAFLVSLVPVCRGSLSWIWLLCGPLVLGGAAQLVGSATETVRSGYQAIAAKTVIQQVGTVILQLALGLFFNTVWVLVAAFVAARSCWVHGSKPGKPGRHLMRVDVPTADLARSAAGALANGTATQIMVIGVGLLYSPVAAAFVAVSNRVMVTPLSMASRSMSVAMVGEVGKFLREGNLYGARRLVRKTLTVLLAVAIPIWLCIFFLCGQVVEVLLGTRWSGAGQFMVAMSLGAVAQFVVLPFSQLLQLTRNTILLVVWDFLRLFSFLGLFLVAWLSGQSVVPTLWASSLIQVCLYAVLCLMVLHSLRREGATDCAVQEDAVR